VLAVIVLVLLLVLLAIFLVRNLSELGRVGGSG
jgi:hypothetical protein